LRHPGNRRTDQPAGVERHDRGGAHGTRLVNDKVAELACAAGKTGQAAETVRDHAGELARQAEALRGQVDRFSHPGPRRMNRRSVATREKPGR
jgi:hypothetical protein